MGRATTARSAGHKLIRSVGSGTFTSTSATITVPGTLAGDAIVALASTSGTPTLTGSGAGGTWNTYRGGSAAPYCFAMVGMNCSAGQTSFTITVSASQAIQYVWFVISGVGTTIRAVPTTWGWTSSTGTVSGSFNPFVGDLVICGFSQFNGATITVANSQSQQVQQRGINTSNQRPVVGFAFVDRTGFAQTVTPTWGNSQTGGGVVLIFKNS